jgi:serine phosphatase RsbU (regulator of sigma subunit)
MDMNVCRKHLRVVEKHPEEIITHLNDEASRWINGNEPDDDLTFVVIKVK